VLRAARILLLFGVVGFGTAHGVAWAKGHPYFAVREIDVEARGQLEAKTILSWSGLANGMSIWDVGERQAEARLLEHPRVRAALVERELPGLVRVHVEEREPVALLFGDPLQMVSIDGEVFPPCEGEALSGLPYISGFAGTDPASGASTSRLRDAARLVAAWRTHEQWPAISEIRPDADELVVFVAGTPLAVRFPPSAGEGDFSRLNTVLDLWKGRERGLVAVDLSLAGEAVLKVRKLKPAAPAKSSVKIPGKRPVPRGILSVADREPRGARARGLGDSST
jgi:hypothetical protein